MMLIMYLEKLNIEWGQTDSTGGLIDLLEKLSLSATAMSEH